jgi:hypothetical protein
VTIDRFLFDKEYHVCESGVVNDCAHVSYETIDGLIINFIFFKFSYVEDANIVEPLATIKASKDKKLLGTDHAGCMSLSSSWCFLKLQRMTPSHCLSIEHI